MDYTYIVCLKDIAIRPDYQERENANQGLGVVKMNCDHCPMVGRPGELVEIIDKILMESWNKA